MRASLVCVTLFVADGTETHPYILCTMIMFFRVCFSRRGWTIDLHENLMALRDSLVCVTLFVADGSETHPYIVRKIAIVFYSLSSCRGWSMTCP